MATPVVVQNTVSVDVADLPTVEASVIDMVPVDVASLPDLKITEIGPMGPLTLAGIPDSFTVAISELPDLNLRLKEIPSIRAHVPANFRLGFSVLGLELAALNLCGEAQIITEPYHPNPCERCGDARRLTQANPYDYVGAVLRVANEA